MMLRAVFVLLLPVCQGHFLWQQTALVNQGRYISSFFIFSELPGIEHAETTRMAKKIFDKGISARFLDITQQDEGGNVQNLIPVLDGKYVIAKLPDLPLPESYLLEASCLFGTWSEGDRPPSLIKYFTSASRARSKDTAEKVHAASTNIFRLDLEKSDYSNCLEEPSHDNVIVEKDDDESSSSLIVCVQAAVVFDGAPLSAHEITFYHGDASDPPVKMVSDEDGIAFLSVELSAANMRVFARVNHNIETPGEYEGAKYERISNWATTALELGYSLENNPLEATTSDASSMENPNEDIADHDSHHDEEHAYHGDRGEHHHEHCHDGANHHHSTHGGHMMGGNMEDESSINDDDKNPPNTSDKAAYARWIAHNTLWGSLATINSRDRPGMPFGNIASFSDGPIGNSDGVIYMLHSGLDASIIDVTANNQISFSISEMQTGYCQGKQIDPEDPRCARLSISGRLVEVEYHEIDTAKEAMFQKHPSMKKWYNERDTMLLAHKFKFYKIQMEEIWLIDYFGGPATISNDAWNRGTDKDSAEALKPKAMNFAGAQQHGNGVHQVLISIRFSIMIAVTSFVIGILLGRKSRRIPQGFEMIHQGHTIIKLENGEAC